MMVIRDKTFRESPYLLTGHTAPFSSETLLDFINVSIIRSLPRWSRRAKETLTDGAANALIFMVSDIENVHAVIKDPRYSVFTEVVKLSQHYDTGTMGDMIPVMSTLKPEDLHHTVP